MIIGRVTGCLYSTIHHPSMAHKKILVIDRLDRALKPTGGYIIALDAVGAGDGETVLVLDEGNGSRQVLNDPLAPVRSMVVGIIDAVDGSPG